MTTHGNTDANDKSAILADEARAKVNLTLRVLGRRADGYHDLASLVVFADCADRLTLDAGPELSLTMRGLGGSDCGATADNLVLKAARLLAERVPGLQVGAFTLDKRLPVAESAAGRRMRRRRFGCSPGSTRSRLTIHASWRRRA
jgi:4-diphosphocytidyl-2-C-methyl-D-erythritol kinase